jgi:hypothetical protein
MMGQELNLLLSDCLKSDYSRFALKNWNLYSICLKDLGDKKDYLLLGDLTNPYMLCCP